MSPEYELMRERVARRGDDIEAIETKLREQQVETPSWAFGNAGTRFAVFNQAGAPRNVFEKLEDAAVVNRLTGVAPSVALHIPWDRVDDWGTVRDSASALGLRIGAINPNLFQELDYKLGSLCNPSEAVRGRASDHLLECVEIARALDSSAISLWLADGTNYPGQDSFLARRERLVESLRPVVFALNDSVDLLIEYKLYEPAFYSTDIADWGSALLLCQELGPRAAVLVDLGHHAHSVNIEQIVALLARAGRLGGFHFNDRKYGDDDLIVGSIDPFQLFLIFTELVAIGAFESSARFMIDQSHNVENRVEAVIQSVLNLQEAYAKSLLVDRAALDLAQSNGDVLAAHRVLHDAFSTDVRPLCAKVRADLGAEADPIAAFAASGYAARIAAARADGKAPAWI